MRDKPTTDELKAAFKRAQAMRFDGWTFDRAMAVPAIAKILGLSAMAHRENAYLAAQASLPLHNERAAA